MIHYTQLLLLIRFENRNEKIWQCDRMRTTARVSKCNKLLLSVGVDYAPLQDLLASSQWQKADEETAAVMLKISRRVAASWLREEDIESFPCLDLQMIDRLWVDYSGDRFGFSVQCRIWESVGLSATKLL